jgi:hypothetical protein
VEVRDLVELVKFARRGIELSVGEQQWDAARPGDGKLSADLILKGFSVDRVEVWRQARK